MSRKKIQITVYGPLLPGSVTTAESTCGKPTCACKAVPPKLHGVYYRWTGTIEGKRTTRTISKEVAAECQKRIRNYRKLQKKLRVLMKSQLHIAPWKH